MWELGRVEKTSRNEPGQGRGSGVPVRVPALPTNPYMHGCWMHLLEWTISYLSQILYLDSSQICFPMMPGTAGPWELDSESPPAGSSVDVPPRPCHTTPDSHFGTEVSCYLKTFRSVCPLEVCTACSELILRSLFDCSLVPHLFLLQNVLRIHVLEAQDLIAKDRFLGGLVKGKSDPYVKLKLAGRSFRSRVVREDLNPRWNEVFEVRTEWPGLSLFFLQAPRVVQKPQDSVTGGSGEWKMQLFGEDKEKILFHLHCFLLLGDRHINSRPRVRG